MQLVLVAGFKPSLNKFGPKVRLFEGKWRVCAEHLVASTLVLRTARGDVGVNNGDIYISDGSIVELGVSVPGNESFINVFAEWLGEK